jgi:5-methylcytosine-specific restriction enzyme subunit McrC
MPPAIPIRNLYYLFCYAWNRFEEGQSIEIGATESPDLLNLFAKVILNATQRLIRRGLDRGYVLVSEDTCCLRGRVVMGEMVKRNLWSQARAHCSFDELQHDVAHNQIVRATIDRLRRAEGVDTDLRHQLGLVLKAFSQVTAIDVTKSAFRRIQLHRNNAYYDLLIRIAELLHDALLPEGDTGRFRFADVLRDEKKMRRIFEEFIRNFFRLEQHQYDVTRDWIKWNLTGEVSPTSDASLLPTMETDVTLRSNSRTLVIDAKYSQETVITSQYGKQILHPDHLYQLFAYLKNLEARNEPDRSAQGVLIYPSAGHDLDLKFRVQGHEIRVRTLNLAAPWRDIRQSLLRVLE